MMESVGNEPGHERKTTMNQTADQIDLGNNETASAGIFLNSDGTFTAMTFTASKTFKTAAGAKRWLARRGYEVQWPEL